MHGQWLIEPSGHQYPHSDHMQPYVGQVLEDKLASNLRTLGTNAYVGTSRVRGQPIVKPRWGWLVLVARDKILVICR
jgi:hypothetical protein